jgi:hypothetical protein
MSGIYKNGTIVSNSFSNDYPIIDMKLMITDDNAIFAKIFHHNNKNGTVLFTPENVLNIQTEDLYSRLYLMEQFRDNDGAFEFIALQPNVDNKVYRWKQTSNPCTESTCTGYEDISNTTAGIKKCDGCHEGKTFIHKNDDSFWQSIGAYNFYQHNGTDPKGIAGFGGNTDENINTGILDFYVRCDNIKNLNKFSIYDKTIVSNEFYEI